MLDKLKISISYGLYLLSVATLALLIGGSVNTLADAEVATFSNAEMEMEDYEENKDVVADSAIKRIQVLPPYGFNCSVSISGDGIVGETLTANITPLEFEAEIVWWASDSPDGEYVEIGTGSTYTLTENDLGKWIKVGATSGINTKLSSALEVKDREKDVGIAFRIPSTVSLARDYDGGGYTGEYEIEVMALGEGDTLIIEPDDELKLRQENKDSVITAFVDQKETEFENIGTAYGMVRILDGERLSAGTWTGSFSFNITTVKSDKQEEKEERSEDLESLEINETEVESESGDLNESLDNDGEDVILEETEQETQEESEPETEEESTGEQTEEGTESEAAESGDVEESTEEVAKEFETESESEAESGKFESLEESTEEQTEKENDQETLETDEINDKGVILEALEETGQEIQEEQGQETLETDDGINDEDMVLETSQEQEGNEFKSEAELIEIAFVESDSLEENGQDFITDEAEERE